MKVFAYLLLILAVLSTPVPANTKLKAVATPSLSNNRVYPTPAFDPLRTSLQRGKLEKQLVVERRKA